jgi:cell division protein FtsW (lipid II flippase)
MDKESEPIVRRMVPRDRPSGGVGPWWRPSPLACWFFAIAGFDALMLLLASGVSSSGNDAAGNGMANAFREVFVQAGAVLVGCIAALFVIVRHRGTRIGLIVTLVLLSLLLPILLH